MIYRFDNFDPYSISCLQIYTILLQLKFHIRSIFKRIKFIHIY